MQTLDLGLIDFQEAWAIQERLAAGVAAGTEPETLLLMEHPPVYTIGSGGSETNILGTGVTALRINRGGDVTWHGPGQLVGYPILDLHNFRMDVGWYVRSLEELLIRTVNAFGLNGRRVGTEQGRRDPKLVGVWVDNPEPEPLLRQVHPDAKLAQIGARIESWITYHGFALNVDPNMQHFQLIVPCGIPDKPVTSMALALGRPPEMHEVRTQVAQQFEQVFGTDLVPISPLELLGRLDKKIPA